MYGALRPGSVALLGLGIYYSQELCIPSGSS
jgi:hypothetical protein